VKREGETDEEFRARMQEALVAIQKVKDEIDRLLAEARAKKAHNA
jgi:hypothetical protein